MKKLFVYLIASIQWVMPAFSQSFSNKGDEQGMEVGQLDLPQDSTEVREALNGWWAESQKTLDERMTWYNEAKFGCFVHWGVSSSAGSIWNGTPVYGYSEHLMRVRKIPLPEYKERLVKPFNPTDFNADEWIQMAVDAGMKYFIITAKHHDGFAMYFSDAYPYDMRMTAYNRDPMAELREAARKHGIKFGFYYSHAFDWEHPNAPGNDWEYPNHPGGDKLLGGRDWWKNKPEFLVNADKYVVEKSIPQIQELIRKYDPDILWFDTPHKLPLYQNLRILKAIREVDPENKIVVNGRLAHVADINFGDYKNTGDRAAFFYPEDGYWESIPTTNESYGYSKVDTSHKPASHFVRLLASATAKGGNILMNVGPMGNGKWDEPDVKIFRQVGEWMKTYGEAIYGNQKTDLPIPSWGVTTQKNDTTYLHVFNWPENGELAVGGMTSDISKAWLVCDKRQKPLPCSRLNDKDVVIKLPALAPDTINTVIGVTLGKKKASDPVRLFDDRGTNVLLAFDATLNDRALEHGDGKVNQNYISNWKNNNQNLKWNFRLNKPATYKVYIQYKTSSIKDSGTVVLMINDKEYNITYPESKERWKLTTLFVADISLDAGEHHITLKGDKYQGNEYMRPASLLFTK